jgi:hypothetical protein
MVVLKANGQWKKNLLTLKNQDNVEVTNRPNADLKFFLTYQLFDLNSALIYSTYFQETKERGINALDIYSACHLGKNSFLVQVNFTFCQSRQS